ncbi:MAG TPA: hypothetical protein VHH34_15080 [Pseudonocardiaceae bacterium]|nr:hypothetical protein [Pseudonocardiaceae bacterium]
MRTAITGLVLVGVLAGCAGQSGQVGFGGSPPAPPEGSASSTVPPQAGGVRPAWPGSPVGGSAVPAAQLDSAALPEGYPRQVWTEDEGRTVGATGQEGGCTQVHSELREQTSEHIRMAFVEVTTSPGPCTMDLRYRPLTVRLDAPLAERTVVLERQTR